MTSRRRSASKSANKLQTNSNTINIATAYGGTKFKGKCINIKILIRCTNEKFNVCNCPLSLKIRDLKGFLEFICGIPYNIQKLCYLDEGELVEHKELQYYDVIEGGTINMDVFSIYSDLVKASVFGNLDDVLKQGVSARVPWTSPTIEYMFQREKIKYIAERAGISLFIACHRGNQKLVDVLVNHEANINYTTGFGRTPVMVAVVADKIDIIDLLLKHNVDIDVCDINGESAVDIAKKFMNKLGQHRLVQFKWRKRTEAEMRKKLETLKRNNGVIPIEDDRLPHQIYDSEQKTWMKGPYLQLYMAQLQAPREFSGTGFSAPKTIRVREIEAHKSAHSTSENHRIKYEDWLSEKLKLEKQQKLFKQKDDKKVEEKKKENPNETTRSTTSVDRDQWMRDYDKEHEILNDLKMQQNQLLKPLIKLEKQKTNEFQVYNGMTYEEWEKIRDAWLAQNSF